MDRIKVNLLNVTPIEVIYNAISKPYKTQDPSIKTIKSVCFETDGIREKHGSVLEHITFNFEVLGSSRCELQEHMRHRMASPTVESTRFALKKIIEEYKDVDFWSVAGQQMVQDLFVMPDVRNLTPDQKKTFNVAHADMIIRCIDHIRSCKSMGIPNDVAKYLIIESWRTNFTWTINWRSFTNFINLRTNPGAHFEIRHIANLMLEEVMKTWVGFVLYKPQFTE